MYVLCSVYERKSGVKKVPNSSTLKAGSHTEEVIILSANIGEYNKYFADMSDVWNHLSPLK